jgi:hypothetical protein
LFKVDNGRMKNIFLVVVPSLKSNWFEVPVQMH